MTTLEKLDHIEKLAKLAEKPLGNSKYEKIDWEDGNSSFELNNVGLIAFHEVNFRKRADARRVADYYGAMNPESMLATIADFRKAINTLHAFSGCSCDRQDIVFKTLKELGAIE